MNSDRTTDGIGAERSEPNATGNPSAVHLDVDGQLTTHHHSLSALQSHSPPAAEIDELERNEQTAALRSIIRLQRQALSRQNARIQQQRSLIAQLNFVLNRLHDRDSAARRQIGCRGWSWIKARLRGMQNQDN